VRNTPSCNKQQGGQNVEYGWSCNEHKGPGHSLLARPPCKSYQLCRFGREIIYHIVFWFATLFVETLYIFIYNILSLSGGGRPFHPFAPSSIHPSSSSRKKKMMEEEEEKLL